MTRIVTWVKEGAYLSNGMRYQLCNTAHCNALIGDSFVLFYDNYNIYGSLKVVSFSPYKVDHQAVSDVELEPCVVTKLKHPGDQPTI